jgi:hypothetical protein
MGDTDGGVAKLCETMQQMLRQLMEQSQAKTSGGFEAVKTLEPNPVKLVPKCSVNFGVPWFTEILGGR